MVGILSPFLLGFGLFSGATLVSGRVIPIVIIIESWLVNLGILISWPIIIPNWVCHPLYNPTKQGELITAHVEWKQSRQ